MASDRARNFAKPITQRAYSLKLAMAVQALAQHRQMSRDLGDNHPFDSIDLSRVGSHTFKKTMVTNMKTAGISTSIISAISGTSARTLESIYDQATIGRQQHAMGQVFAPIWASVSREHCG